MSGEIARANQQFLDAKRKTSEEAHRQIMAAVQSEHSTYFAQAQAVAFVHVDGHPVDLTQPGSVDALDGKIKP